LELLRVDHKVELGQLAQVSLEVEAALLNEHLLLVTHALLGGHLREHDARPSLLEAFVEDEELIKSSLTLPFTLEILSFDFIDNVTMEVLWVLHREGIGILISEDVSLLGLEDVLVFDDFAWGVGHCLAICWGCFDHFILNKRRS
jgi:hypothetical protein